MASELGKLVTVGEMTDDCGDTVTVKLLDGVAIPTVLIVITERRRPPVMAALSGALLAQFRELLDRAAMPGQVPPLVTRPAGHPDVIAWDMAHGDPGPQYDAD